MQAVKTAGLESVDADPQARNVGSGKPDTPRSTQQPSETQRRAYTLALLRAGHIRLRLMQTEIDSVGVALKAGLVDTDGAWAWLDDIGATPLVEMTGAQ